MSVPGRADGQNEVMEQEFVDAIVAARAEGDFAIGRSEANWGIAFAVDAKMNVGVRQTIALETRLQPQLGKV